MIVSMSIFDHQYVSLESEAVSSDYKVILITGNSCLFSNNFRVLVF